MFRIWAKVLKEDRIQKQFVYESDKTFSYSDFFTYLSDICVELDVPRSEEHTSELQSQR